METLELELPNFWATAMMYGEEDGYEPEDLAALTDFTSWMLEKYGQCWCVDIKDGGGFSWRHDASRFGVLACETSTYVFDITKR